MIWPNNKSFALTIIDDTDFATIENIKPVYDYLYNNGIISTKTVWTYSCRDSFKGQSLADCDYLAFIRDLSQKGFEIASHGAGSGLFTREEILASLEDFKNKIGYYPNIFINHASNSDCIYWGVERFSSIFRFLYIFARKVLRKKQIKSGGSNPDSISFWGDVCKEKIQYIRGCTFNAINTLKIDRRMPFIVKKRIEYSNFWFSSSDGRNCEEFCRLLSAKNINSLEREHGLCIVYTHFAYGFYKNGKLDDKFINCIDYLATKNGYYAPASEILNYLKNSQKKNIYMNFFPELFYNIKWFCDRIIKEIRGKF